MSKYLLYAIGEILLVVIGILIALSIDNSNTYNQDRNSEADYLKRLTIDLSRDTFNYSWTSVATLEKQKALVNLLTYLKNDQLKAQDSADILKQLFDCRKLSFAHPNVTTGTFEELKNTGSFKQIRNTSLRSAITNYYFTRGHHYQRIEKKRIEPGFGDEIDKIIPGFKTTDGVPEYRTDLVSFKEIIENISKPEFKKIIVSEFNLAIFMYDIQQDGLQDSRNLLNQLIDEMAPWQN